MSELFTESEMGSLCPLDQWMLDNNIHALDFGDHIDLPWVARNGTAVTVGHTKEMACHRMAKKLGIKFYR